MPRTIVNVLVLTTVTSTISSRAVSGSMTTVNVVPAGTVAPPSSAEPETTVQLVAESVRLAASVVCCERDEYFLVVIYLPIGCSERELDMRLVVYLFLL